MTRVGSFQSDTEPTFRRKERIKNVNSGELGVDDNSRKLQVVTHYCDLERTRG